MMTEEQYRELQKEHPDVLKEGLGSVVTGVESAEKGNKQLGEIRDNTGERLKAASEVKLSVEQAELLENLEKQYPQMQATLEKYEIPTTGMPTWEQVKRGLTPEVLDKALRHRFFRPILLLVPPTTRQSKLEAINKRATRDQRGHFFAYDLTDNDLWNGGKSENENKWRASIVEGAQNPYRKIGVEGGTYNKMSRALAKEYENSGLDVINDTDTYLTLQMRGREDGYVPDTRNFTVLNSKNLTESSPVACGEYGDLVGVQGDDSARVDSGLDLRGLVEVDVQS